MVYGHTLQYGQHLVYLQYGQHLASLTCYDDHPTVVAGQTRSTPCALVQHQQNNTTSPPLFPSLRMPGFRICQPVTLIFHGLSNWRDLRRRGMMKSGTIQQSCLYTQFAGYKFCLFVCPKSKGFDDDGKGTHVSVFISFMKGDNDDNLKFPFNG